MVTLASSTKGNQQRPAAATSGHHHHAAATFATAASANLKSPMRFDRQQSARCSKKIKRQQPQNNNSYDSPDNKQFHTSSRLAFDASPAGCGTSFMGFNSRVVTTTCSSLAGDVASNSLSVQLLACHEDSSFIYNQNSSSNNQSTSLLPSESLARRALIAPRSNSSHSTTDSLISSSPSSSSSSFSSFGPASSARQHQVDDLQITLKSSSSNNNNRLRLNSSDYYSSSASPSCISALDYCHLYSSSASNSPSGASSPASSSRLKSYPLAASNQQQQLQRQQQQQTRPEPECFSLFHQQQQQHQQSVSGSLDPVYLEDDQVFRNLLAKERAEIARRQAATLKRQRNWPQLDEQPELPLAGQARHSLLSWMLKVCEQQQCQDEIFSLATMILDKFLLLQPPPPQSASRQNNVQQPSGGDHDQDLPEAFECDEDELQQRQLYLFAACSLLLATKLRQTPRLPIQTLIEHSHSELPVELNRDEIYDGELLVLAALKWDLAALVTPNDFLSLLLNKCRPLAEMATAPAAAAASADAELHQDNCYDYQDRDEIENKRDKTTTTSGAAHAGKRHQHQHQSASKRCEESRVGRHTQTLLELCLMDTQLSRYPPSILATASMAVAIDGLSKSSDDKTCWRLESIVAQIHEASHKVNELKLMIDVAFQIEKYVQRLLNSTHDD